MSHKCSIQYSFIKVNKLFILILKWHTTILQRIRIGRNPFLLHCTTSKVKLREKYIWHWKRLWITFYTLTQFLPIDLNLRPACIINYLQNLWKCHMRKSSVTNPKSGKCKLSSNALLFQIVSIMDVNNIFLSEKFSDL